MTKAFPWHDLMRVGLGRLRLAPDQFWSMTPRELSAAIEGLPGMRPRVGTMSRDRLAELTRQFPDTHFASKGGPAHG